MSENPSLSDAVTAPPDIPDAAVDGKEEAVEQATKQLEEQAGGLADSEVVQDVDAELEEMKRRLAQMEAESAVVKEQGKEEVKVEGANGEKEGPNGSASVVLGANAAAAANDTQQQATGAPPGDDSIADADARSIYVGNVDYSATGDQLSAHFADCGTINRVTIMCNKSTGQPKGYAYIEFQDHNAAQNALILDESTFLSRPLKIVAKRTNVPAVYRGGYGRGRGRYTRGGRGYMRRPRRPRGRWAPY